MKAKTCEDAHCRRKGYWIETDDKGERLYCHNARHGGEIHVIKKPLGEILELLTRETEKAVEKQSF